MTKSVTIACPKCETHTRVPGHESYEKIRRHNEKRHDGEKTAGVRVEVSGDAKVLPHPEDMSESALESDSEAVDLIKNLVGYSDG